MIKCMRGEEIEAKGDTALRILTQGKKLEQEGKDQGIIKVLEKI